MTSIILHEQRNKLFEPVIEEKCPFDYSGELLWLWRKYNAGGMYE